MVRLRTQRTAFLLYAVLLVLPTLVLGILHWRQLASEYQAELQGLPTEANDAALRLSAELRDRLQRLIAQESERPFHQYAERYCPDETCESGVLLVPSPLLRDPRPEGVLGWFAFDVQDAPDPLVETFLGNADPEEAAALRSDLSGTGQRFALRTTAEAPLRRAARMGDVREIHVPMALVAAHRLLENDPGCLRSTESIMQGHDLTLFESPFQVVFYTEEGQPRIVATRRILMDEEPELAASDPCLKSFSTGFGLVQGFWVDPQWLLEALPSSLARTVLGFSQRFVPAGAPPCCDGKLEYHAEVRPVADLGFETYDDTDRSYGLLRIAVDSQPASDRFHAREMRFLALAGMLLFTLGTGMALLLRGVHRELEQAARTENFVAAVTHELRTPLSSIKLHAEMLLDGWAKDEHKQREYFRRISRETERLSAMVERVLEKSRLSAGRTNVAPGDLNRSILALEPQLARTREDEHPDLAFALAEELPPVMMAPEAIASIVTNLVENARKYAPATAAEGQKNGVEPIRVVTEQDGDRIVLEVQDRGPGIPESERERIFEAFYRVGNEKTRRARGTGLGLHLVALHAEALGGRASVVDRPGGGSIFRIELRAAPHD